MQIAIDYTPALRQGAGIGRYTRSLVDALSRLDGSNEYTLFCQGRTPERVRWPDNFRIRTTRIPARWLALAWHRLRLPVMAEWLVGRCDIYHSPDFTLPPLARARGVVTVHDLSFLRLPQYADPGLAAYLSAAVPSAVRRANRVLADSSSTQRDIVELLGVSPGKVDVVPAGVDERFGPVREPEILASIRSRHRLPDHYILAVGTLEPRKNLSRLIMAYAMLRKHRQLPQDLVIAGRPGWLYDEIYAQAEREEVADFVHFTGYVEDADLPALYTLADLMVFPSLYEGFGIPPLEAMACGTPVVTSDNSSLPEAVGPAALMVDAEDTAQLAAAMHKVLGDADLRQHLRELGVTQAALFTWERAAQLLLKSYEAAVES